MGYTETVCMGCGFIQRDCMCKDKAKDDEDEAENLDDVLVTKQSKTIATQTDTTGPGVEQDGQRVVVNLPPGFKLKTADGQVLATGANAAAGAPVMPGQSLLYPFHSPQASAQWMPQIANVTSLQPTPMIGNLRSIDIPPAAVPPPGTMFRTEQFKMGNSNVTIKTFRPDDKNKSKKDKEGKKAKSGTDKSKGAGEDTITLDAESGVITIEPEKESNKDSESKTGEEPEGKKKKKKKKKKRTVDEQLEREMEELRAEEAADKELNFIARLKRRKKRRTEDSDNEEDDDAEKKTESNEEDNDEAETPEKGEKSKKKKKKAVEKKKESDASEDEDEEKDKSDAESDDSSKDKNKGEEDGDDTMEITPIEIKPIEDDEEMLSADEIEKRNKEAERKKKVEKRKKESEKKKEAAKASKEKEDTEASAEKDVPGGSKEKDTAETSKEKDSAEPSKEKDTDEPSQDENTEEPSKDKDTDEPSIENSEEATEDKEITPANDEASQEKNAEPEAYPSYVGEKKKDEAKKKAEAEKEKQKEAGKADKEKEADKTKKTKASEKKTDDDGSETEGASEGSSSDSSSEDSSSGESEDESPPVVPSGKGETANKTKAPPPMKVKLFSKMKPIGTASSLKTVTIPGNVRPLGTSGNPLQVIIPATSKSKPGSILAKCNYSYSSSPHTGIPIPSHPLFGHDKTPKSLIKPIKIHDPLGINLPSKPPVEKPAVTVIGKGYGKFEFAATGEQMLRCTIYTCGQVFDTERFAEVHTDLHKHGSMKDLCCKLCGYKGHVQKWYDMLRHLKQSHGSVLHPKVLPPKPKKKSEEDKKTEEPDEKKDIKDVKDVENKSEDGAKKEGKPSFATAFEKFLTGDKKDDEKDSKQDDGEKKAIEKDGTEELTADDIVKTSTQEMNGEKASPDTSINEKAQEVEGTTQVVEKLDEPDASQKDKLGEESTKSITSPRAEDDVQVVNGQNGLDKSLSPDVSVDVSPAKTDGEASNEKPTEPKQMEEGPKESEPTISVLDKAANVVEAIAEKSDGLSALAAICDQMEPIKTANVPNGDISKGEEGLNKDSKEKETDSTDKDAKSDSTNKKDGKEITLFIICVHVILAD